MSEIRTVGFLGTGAMGFPMARIIAQHGIAVRAWNRSQDKAAALSRFGVTVCATPREALEGADALVTMLADGPATASAIDGLLRDDLLWLQMGTIGIDWLERLAAQAEAAGTTLVDAPVLGTRAPAESGDLIVLASGPASALDASAPVFGAVGSRTTRLGEAGQSTRMKLVMNFWFLSQTALAGEALALAESLGVGGKSFLDTIAGTIADSAYVQVRGPRMLARDWSETNFRLELARKDIALAEDAGAATGLDLTIARAVVEEMTRAIDRGFGDADFTSVMEATSASG